MRSTRRNRVLIVGAGISGLAAAWWLQKRGLDVTVLEQSDRAGGAIQTEIRDGFLVEHGPNSTLETTPLIGTLLDELGIRGELIYAEEYANNRYVVRNGQLHALPTSPSAFVKTGLWSLQGKTRLLLEPFHGRAKSDESVAQFVGRRLGREFLDYAIDPFVAGVYAGDPDFLSVRAAFPKLFSLEERYGGLVLGLIRGRKERSDRAEVAKNRAKMFSFRGGMETLPRAIASRLKTRIQNRIANCKLCPQERSDEGQSGHQKGWLLEYTQDGHPGRREVDAVVIATPAYEAAGMVAELDPETSKALRRVPYPPVAVVFMGADERNVGRRLDGFGFLVPTRERRSILGTIWNSTVFSGRAPAGCAAFTTFVGGSRQADLVSLSDDRITQLVLNELRSLVDLRGLPSLIVIRRWNRAIPQYNLGHTEIIRSVDNFENTFPGVFFCNNFRGGIAVGDCILNSSKIAGRVDAYLREQHKDSGRLETRSVTV